MSLESCDDKLFVRLPEHRVCYARSNSTSLRRSTMRLRDLIVPRQMMFLLSADCSFCYSVRF